MTRDSSFTQIHFLSPRHADLFEEFCRPPTTSFLSTNGTSTTTTTNPNDHHGHHASTTTAGNANANNPNGSTTSTLPGHFLAFEEIQLPLHLQPLNPEDEDDVLPDMHAAFGINRALNQGGGAGGAGAGGGGNGGAGGGAGGGGGGAGGEASSAGVLREPVWRDLGIEGLVGGNGAGEGGTGFGVGAGAGAGGAGASGMGIARGGLGVGISGAGGHAGIRREGRRTGMLLLR